MVTIHLRKGLLETNGRLRLNQRIRTEGRLLASGFWEVSESPLHLRLIFTSENSAPNPPTEYFPRR